MPRFTPLLALSCLPFSIAVAQQQVGPAGAPAAMATSAAPFSDVCAAGIAGIVVRAGWWVDGIQVICAAATGATQAQPARGGSGGGGQTFMLRPGERLTAVSGSWQGNAGPYIYSLQLHTDRQSSPVFGNGGDDRGRQTFRLEVPAGRELRGLTGRASDYLYSLGLVVGLPVPTAMLPTPAPTAAAGPSASGKTLAVAPTTLTRPAAPPTPTPAAAPASPAAPAAPVGKPAVAPGAAVTPVTAARGRLTPMQVPAMEGSGTGGPWCPARGFTCTDAEDGLRWRDGVGRNVPAGGLAVGREGDRDLYVCRVYFTDGSRLAGKTGQGFEGCNVGVNGRELVASSYELLLALPPAVWIARSGDPNELYGGLSGFQLRGQHAALCRAQYSGGTHPGYVVPGRGCIIGWGDREIAVPSFEMAVTAGGS